jgi:SAM-dependent methyltransferase
VSEGHYAQVGARYEEGAFYDPSSSYNRWLAPRVSASLGLVPTSRFADIGGGTGGFTSALADLVGLEEPPCVVEPSPLREQAGARGLQVSEHDALTFAATSPGEAWDAVLLKEVVHHLSLAEFPTLAGGLARALAPEGRVLIVTRPVVPDYPLFSAARVVWRIGQPPAERYAEPLRSSGLEVSSSEHAFPFQIPKTQWFELIRRRFWSTFSHFSDDQLEVGIAEIDAQNSGEVLHFEERLTFVEAQRPA